MRSPASSEPPLQNLILGTMIGIGTGMIMGLLATGITWKMDQIIAGVIINIIATV